MPTVISHGIFAISLGHLFRYHRLEDSGLPLRFWVLALACTMLPDLDVIGFSLGVKYAEFWGHRGFSHSLMFALLTSLLMVSLGFYQAQYRPYRWRLVLFYFLVTASHGLFDALTNGGLGIAFFSPFDDTRYFLPWRPIQVSPIGLHDFLKWGGLKVLSSEMKWIGLPSLALLVFSLSLRLFLRRQGLGKIKND